MSINETENLYGHSLLGRLDRGLHIHFSTNNLKCNAKSLFNETVNIKTPLLLIDGSYVSKYNTFTVHSA